MVFMRTWMIIGLLACLLASCTKNEESSVYFIKQKFPDVLAYIPTELLETMGNENLNFGDMPPDIQKQVVADPLLVRHSSWDSLSTGCQLPFVFHVAFLHQHDAVAAGRFLADFKVSSVTDTVYAIADTVYVMGEDPYFTAYYKEVLHSPDSTMPHLSVVVSGEITDDGIKDFVMGCRVDSYGDFIGAQADGLAPIGSIIVFEDADGMAVYERKDVD